MFIGTRCIYDWSYQSLNVKYNLQNNRKLNSHVNIWTEMESSENTIVEYLLPNLLQFKSGYLMRVVDVLIETSDGNTLKCY